MFKHFATVMFGVVVLTCQCANAALSAGDLLFIGLNCDSDKDFALVAMTDISNETVYFRDDEPTSTSGFDGIAEGTVQWNTGTPTITAGTVITFSDVSDDTIFSVTHGSLSESNASLDPGASGDGIWVYQTGGTYDDNVTTWVTAIATQSFGSANPGPSGVAIDDLGLTNGTNALDFTGSDDIFAYTGTRLYENTLSELATVIYDESNWIFEDGTGDQAGNEVAPDLPFDTTSFVPEPATLVFLGLALFAAGRRFRLQM